MHLKEFILGILCAIILLLGSQYFYNKKEFYSLNLPVRFINYRNAPPVNYEVKIIGAVKNPGVVVVTNSPPRLIDAISLAGGLKAECNFEAINFAENIEKAQLIMIPFKYQDEVIIIKKPKHKYKKRKHKKHRHKKHKHKKKRKKKKRKTLAQERFMAKLFQGCMENEDYLATYDNAINSLLKDYKKGPKKKKEKESKENIPAKEGNTQTETINNIDKKETKSESSLSKPSKEKNKKKELPSILVDLNTATKEELLKLPGIGDKTAEAIIDYRAEHPIKTKEDILNIKGIGPKKLEKLLPYLKLDDNKSAGE